jgi:hypothetical protein
MALIEDLNWHAVKKKHTTIATKWGKQDIDKIVEVAAWHQLHQGLQASSSCSWESRIERRISKGERWTQSARLFT